MTVDKFGKHISKHKVINLKDAENRIFKKLQFELKSISSDTLSNSEIINLKK
jgi:hypothetical protein